MTLCSLPHSIVCVAVLGSNVVLFVLTNHSFVLVIGQEERKVHVFVLLVLQVFFLVLGVCRRAPPSCDWFNVHTAHVAI